MLHRSTPAAPPYQVAAYLGPPSLLLRRSLGLDPDDAIRLIELAESMLAFNTPGAQEAAARYNHARVLQMMPGELPLHYKVWQLLLATRRQAEATASYRTTCQRAACDPGTAAYHGTLTPACGHHPPHIAHNTHMR